MVAGVLEHESIAHDGIAGPDSGQNQLLSGDHSAGLHFHAVEGRHTVMRNENPIFVLEMQNGGGGNEDALLLVQIVKGGPGKHAEAKHSLTAWSAAWGDAGIFHVDASLRRPDIGIEDGANVADSASKNRSGIGVQADFGGFVEVDHGEVVFVDIANDPDVG